MEFGQIGAFDTNSCGKPINLVNAEFVYFSKTFCVIKMCFNVLFCKWHKKRLLCHSIQSDNLQWNYQPGRHNQLRDIECSRTICYIIDSLHSVRPVVPLARETSLVARDSRHHQGCQVKVGGRTNVLFVQDRTHIGGKVTNHPPFALHCYRLPGLNVGLKLPSRKLNYQLKCPQGVLQNCLPLYQSNFQWGLT